MLLEAHARANIIRLDMSAASFEVKTAQNQSLRIQLPREQMEKHGEKIRRCLRG
jgi:hypothetical protein